MIYLDSVNAAVSTLESSTILRKNHAKQNALLLSGSGYKDTGYLTHALDYINSFIKDNNLWNKKIVFIPYARVIGGDKAYNIYEERVKNALSSLNLKIISIHHAKNPAKEIENANCIIVGGGNTFKLVHDLYEGNLIELISKKVKEGSFYIGWSAGSNIAGATIKTTNDMPIIQPRSFNTLNIFPHQINPHYISGKPIGYNGESREDRLNEYLETNRESIVFALPEGTALLLKGNKAKVLGESNVLKMQYNKEVQKIKPNSVFEY